MIPTLQLLHSAPPPVLHRWRLDFSTPYGSAYWCEVDAPTALAAVTAALRHVNERNASAMFFATEMQVRQLAGDFTN